MTDSVPPLTQFVMPQAPSAAADVSFQIGTLSGMVRSLENTVSDLRTTMTQAFNLLKETRDSIALMTRDYGVLNNRVEMLENDINEMKTSMEDLKAGKWMRAGIASFIGAMVAAAGSLVIPLVAGFHH